MMSRRALASSADAGWFDNVLWEHEQGAVVLIIPENISVWRGFIMSQNTSRVAAERAVTLFAELYFGCGMSLSEAWEAAETLTSSSD